MNEAIRYAVTILTLTAMMSGSLPPVGCAVSTVCAEASDVDIYSEDELKLIARVTEAEAGCEDKYGQRLVIDTILNRIDSDRFPDTVKGVVYQKNQFSVVSNGSMKSSADDDILELVKEELEERTNDEVLFFQQGGYSKWGEALFKHGSHYFCGD